MPKNVTIVQVFVASPSDVQEEREVLETLIEELNRTWSRSLSVMFELIRWESYVRPAIGTDPQAVINDQIAESYDVLIGILWGRAGAPTPRAVSGTIEEFERAYTRQAENDRTPEIMIYFKDSPLPPSKIDPEQLLQVQKFRQSLSDRGCLYSTFEDQSSFQSSLRAHLATLAQKFSTSRPTQTLANSISTPISTDTKTTGGESEEDFGYLDFLEIYNARMAIVTETFHSITEATTRVVEQMEQRTAEIKQHQKSAQTAGTVRRIIKRSADDLNLYADTLSSKLPALTTARTDAFQALSNALALYGDFQKQSQNN